MIVRVYKPCARMHRETAYAGAGPHEPDRCACMYNVGHTHVGLLWGVVPFAATTSVFEVSSAKLKYPRVIPGGHRDCEN